MMNIVNIITVNVTKKMIVMNSKKISKERLISLGKTIGLMDKIIHSNDDVVIINDPKLSNEIYALKYNVKLFEELTDIKLQVNIKEGSK